MEGGGSKAGTTYVETDDFACNFLKDPVHVHDLHPTMLHLLDIARTSPGDSAGKTGAPFRTGGLSLPSTGRPSTPVSPNRFEAIVARRA